MCFLTVDTDSPVSVEIDECDGKRCPFKSDLEQRQTRTTNSAGVQICKKATGTIPYLPAEASTLFVKEIAKKIPRKR